MTNLVQVLSDLHNAGKEILLVSSGAIGMGVGKLNLPERPKDTPSKQAAAAVGQCELMHIYDDMFSKYSITVAQILLTKPSFRIRNVASMYKIPLNGCCNWVSFRF